MSESLTLAALSAAVRESAALRSITRLQPVDGEEGKVFPATFREGRIAIEKRRIVLDGSERVVECVLLNSTQSEANHGELSLLDAVERGTIQLPLIEVNFSEANSQFRKDLPNLTTLEVPHRLADAILRDSELTDGTSFAKSSYAARWSRANLWNATAIYELCPTALVFGMWGSPEKPGGLGAKFERAFISEIIGVDSLQVDQRFGFRVDPIAASKKVPVLPNGNGGFDVVAEKTKNAQRPSELNHGNIPFTSNNGGVRCRYVEQTTVISMGALRKLRFPVNGQNNVERDDAVRTVLAAIALCAGVLASERGLSLRSRCTLQPTAPRKWEMLSLPGEEPTQYTVNGEQATTLLQEAVKTAESKGIRWMTEKLVLKPSKGLVDLIRASQEKATAEGETEGE